MEAGSPAQEMGVRVAGGLLLNMPATLPSQLTVSLPVTPTSPSIIQSTWFPKKVVRLTAWAPRWSTVVLPVLSSRLPTNGSA